MRTNAFLFQQLTDMPIDSEATIGLYRHGRTATFRIRRTAKGYQEQNDLYGMEDGVYGLPMDVGSMIEEINSILDK